MKTGFIFDTINPVILSGIFNARIFSPVLLNRDNHFTYLEQFFRTLIHKHILIYENK